MAEIIQNPELRYTSDTQTPIAEMLVEFPGQREEDPASTLKVVGWGNLAQEIQERYHQGDRVIIEGRLSMSTIDRQEGFKEKRAELTVQRIHNLGTDVSLSASLSSMPTSPTSKPLATAAPVAKTPTRAKAAAPKPPVEQPDYDDIPFARPVNFDAIQSGLQDSWESTATRCWVGIE